MSFLFAGNAHHGQQNTNGHLSASGPARELLENLTQMVAGSSFKPRKFPALSTKPPHLNISKKVLSTDNLQPNNPWDLRNQQAMLDVERSMGHKDMQALYGKMQSMREIERAEMENMGLVDAEATRKSLQDAITFQGSCQDMCPIFERIRRTYENNIKASEKDPITQQVTAKYAVKAFSRPAAGQPPPLPSDVRPPPLLEKTTRYLIQRSLSELPQSHSFLWDRSRSIRQDFTYQNYAGPEAVRCHELIARTHIVCLHQMASFKTEYSRQQELEQLTKTIQSLIEFYEDSPGTYDPAEIRAYQLLLHLRDPDVEQQIQAFPELLNQPIIVMALQLRWLAQTNNPGYAELVTCFFDYIQQPQVPFLLACVAEVHFNEIRVSAVKTFSKCYHTKSRPYSMDSFVRLLGFDSFQEAVDFCDYYGMHHTDTEVDLRTFKDQILKPQPFSRIVEAKKPSSLESAVLSPRLPTTTPTQFSEQKAPLVQTDHGHLNMLNNPFPKQTPSLPTPQHTLPSVPIRQPPPSIQFPLLSQSNLKPAIAPASLQTQTNQKPPAPKQTPFSSLQQTELTQAIDAVITRTLLSLVKNVVHDVVLHVWGEVSAKRQMRENFILSACSRIYQTMISTMVHKEVIKAQARRIDQTRLRRLAIKLIRKTTEVCIDRNLARQRRLTELTQVSQSLGRKRKAIRSTKSISSLPRTQTPSESLDDMSQSNLIEIVSDRARDLWEPLDLESILVPRLSAALRKHRFRSLKISVFCRDWIDTIQSKWTASVLGIRDLKSRTLECATCSIVIGPLSGDMSLNRNTGILIFECGLQAESPGDREGLELLVGQVAAHSKYSISLLIAYWGELSETEVLGDLNVSKHMVEQTISSFVFCRLGDHSDQQVLESDVALSKGLANIADLFSGSPSIRYLALGRSTSSHSTEMRPRTSNEKLDGKPSSQAAVLPMRLFQPAYVGSKRRRSSAGTMSTSSSVMSKADHLQGLSELKLLVKSVMSELY